MPWQLIYTSAPRGLLSGQSGFCTVARSGDLREALVQRLEQISSYHYLRVAEVATASRNPTVCAFRILDLRGSKYHVLTRIQPCGLDFTARTNHLAHHLVFQAGELAQLPSPAAILRHWNGWLASWQGEPRVLGDPALDSFSAAAAKSFLPAQTWLRVTGDAGRAAGLLESECIRGCYLVCPPGSEAQVLEMFCETLQLLNLNGQYALRPWRHPFTTFLQAEDNPADFQWRACQEGTPAYQQAAQRAVALMPLRSVRVPNNSLVKVAREGQKPAAPPAAASSTQTSLSLRSRAPGKRPSGTEMTDTGHWQNPVMGPEKPSFLSINFSINSGSLLRIGIFAAVLLILLLIRIKMNKLPLPQESVPETPPVQVVSAPPARYTKPQAPAIEPSHNETHAPLDPAQLNCLSRDGPTYVFTTPNMINFDLPIDSISRLQNLIQRFDHLQTRPNDVQLSLNTDAWDFTAGAPLTVNVRQTELSTTTAKGMECLFDYSNWKNNSNNPVAIHTVFPSTPNAFSVHFGFSIPSNGDPFRLLIVNESNAPVPLHLSMQWLKTNCESVAASLQAPLGERLYGNFLLPRGRLWRLLPFIRAKGAAQARSLYQDWPAEDLPPLGDELNFARVKGLLIAQQIPLHKKVDLQAKKLEQQKEQAGLDVPVGQYLGLSSEAKLASFSAYADVCSRDDFIDYLNLLKEKLKIARWPLLSKEDENNESDLAAKFQQIYDSCVDKNPAAQSKLMLENDNYFSTVWRHLKEIEKTRQEQQRARNEVDKLKVRLNSVPGTLDKVAYVGLFIIDPPKPGLEMIRFQGP